MTVSGIVDQHIDWPVFALRLLNDVRDAVEIGYVAEDRAQFREGLCQRFTRSFGSESPDDPVTGFDCGSGDGQPKARVRPCYEKRFARHF
ncbi:hypothetical protein AGR1A_pAt20450 [Agrobacterium fabacearum CFBP 5771]|nr:hypothetical protein AGR1A_pAt20450 [Agrobacterium fabacearum CFBP 5771]